jgi:hypothetical protein
MQAASHFGRDSRYTDPVNGSLMDSSSWCAGQELCRDFFCPLLHPEGRPPLCPTELVCELCSTTGCPYSHVPRHWDHQILLPAIISPEIIHFLRETLPAPLEHLQDLRVTMKTNHKHTITLLEAEEGAEPLLQHYKHALLYSPNSFYNRDLFVLLSCLRQIEKVVQHWKTVNMASQEVIVGFERVSESQVRVVFFTTNLAKCGPLWQMIVQWELQSDRLMETDQVNREEPVLFDPVPVKPVLVEPAPVEKKAKKIRRVRKSRKVPNQEPVKLHNEKSRTGTFEPRGYWSSGDRESFEMREDEALALRVDPYQMEYLKRRHQDLLQGTTFDSATCSLLFNPDEVLESELNSLQICDVLASLAFQSIPLGDPVGQLQQCLQFTLTEEAIPCELILITQLPGLWVLGTDSDVQDALQIRDSFVLLEKHVPVPEDWDFVGNSGRLRKYFSIESAVTLRIQTGYPRSLLIISYLQSQIKIAHHAITTHPDFLPEGAETLTMHIPHEHLKWLRANDRELTQLSHEFVIRVSFSGLEASLTGILAADARNSLQSLLSDIEVYRIPYLAEEAERLITLFSYQSGCVIDSGWLVGKAAILTKIESLCGSLVEVF